MSPNGANTGNAWAKYRLENGSRDCCGANRRTAGTRQLAAVAGPTPPLPRHRWRRVSPRATLADLLATAGREMAQFPGRRLEDWKARLHALVEYRALQQYDPLYDALRAPGLK